MVDIGVDVVTTSRLSLQRMLSITDMPYCRALGHSWPQCQPQQYASTASQVETPASPKQGDGKQKVV